MPRKDSLDTFGVASLVGFSLLLGINQVVIAVVNEGLQPVFAAAIRSVGATLCIGFWMTARGTLAWPAPGTVPSGLLMGAIFSAEFVFLFNALDLTSVSRTSVIFYAMPVWAALGAHFLLPGESMTRVKALGLALAFAGTAWAILDRPETDGRASLVGDLCALAAGMCWAGIALAARATAMKEVAPDMQLLWQVAVSAPILLILALSFGPLIRDLAPIHLWGMAFQIVVVVSAGFMFWLWLLTIYPAASVASFAFLGPIFGVLLGALVLGEDVGPTILGPLALVAGGLWLINRPGAPSA
ncbi:MAG: DMT family transporter [Pseudomonadota bacterium]